MELYFSRKKPIKLPLVLLLLALVLSGCNARKTTFVKPDIKDNFCGIIMNFQYCKCAFHNQYCDVVGLSPSTANWYVRSEYQRWVNFLRNRFYSNCEAANGRAGRNVCYHCDPPNEWFGNDCLLPEQNEDGEEEEEAVFRADGPLTNDCAIDEAAFAAEWRKYSDIDSRIPADSRSWEAKNLLSAQEKLIKLKADNFVLQRDMEIDRQIRLEAREYREKLVQNQKSNLIKALIRMTYLTYTTIKSGSSAGQSFEKFLTGSEVLARAGGLLNTVKTVIPNDSRLAIDTSSIGGKAANVGLSTAISALENLGDPTEVAKTFMTESRNSVMPSANLSDEEIAILRDHYIVKKHIDFALAESYEVNKQRRKQVNENNRQIAQLEAEAAAWEAEEKSRVREMLVSQCEREKKSYEDKK